MEEEDDKWGYVIVNMLLCVFYGVPEFLVKHYFKFVYEGISGCN